MKNKIMYEGMLDRFGSYMTVLAETEEECKRLLMEAYVEEYKRTEGCYGDPRKEIAYDRGSDKTYYDEALDSIEISEYEVGKVRFD